MKSSKTDPYLNLIFSGIVDRQSLKKFQKRIGYKFRSEAFLVNAFVHRSFVAEPVRSNERLEFLGDSVLSLILSTFLYERFPDRDEGFLTQHRSAMVCENSLYEIACRLEMEELLIVGKSERNSTGRFRKAPVADSVEALIGAIYLDGGWNAANRFVLRFFPQQFTEAVQEVSSVDPKTRLQMFVQKQWKTLPRYRILKKTGPDHDAVFFVEVTICEERWGEGNGSSRKAAEIQAAEEAIDRLIEKKLWSEKD